MLGVWSVAVLTKAHADEFFALEYHTVTAEDAASAGNVAVAMIMMDRPHTIIPAGSSIWLTRRLRDANSHGNSDV